MGRGPTWSEEDKALLLDSSIPTAVLAGRLGRSPKSVTSARINLKKKLGIPRRVYRVTEEVETDYDLRPAGWYEETIGLILFDYPDALGAWKHYHSYTELEVVEEHATGWITMRCYRDA